MPMMQTDNKIGDDGLIELARALKTNKSLTALNLKCAYVPSCGHLMRCTREAGQAAVAPLFPPGCSDSRTSPTLEGNDVGNTNTPGAMDNDKGVCALVCSRLLPLLYPPAWESHPHYRSARNPIPTRP